MDIHYGLPRVIHFFPGLTLMLEMSLMGIDLEKGDGEAVTVNIHDRRLDVFHRKRTGANRVGIARVIIELVVGDGTENGGGHMSWGTMLIS